ncbi:twin-arginine translocation signal domain-containing protein [Larkinella knui]|uniref:Twin-arginine translocation signal domain-containing protein n=1 Tax=Larkinella knui TaxID=2025310 RepID=A0A3P1CQL5_9BACT|nr:twin-arginine translocation signal domain-containing protein [Larkinella knui]
MKSRRQFLKQSSLAAPLT